MEPADVERGPDGPSGCSFDSAPHSQPRAEPIQPKSGKESSDLLSLSSSEQTELEPSCRPQPSFSEKERYWILQNHRLKSTLIHVLEGLQEQIAENSRMRRLISRLLELRAQQQQQQPRPCSGQDSDRTELYKKYEDLVKQNYRLEQTLKKARRQIAIYPGQDAKSTELERFKALAKMQVAAAQQDWREERDEKEHLQELNARLHQEVERLQHQLDEMRQRLDERPRSPPDLGSFETVGLSGFSMRSPAVPSAKFRPPLPPPSRLGLATSGGSLPSPRPAERCRGVSSRSVDEVLSAPYEAVQPARRRPLSPPGPVQSDERRRRLVALDSGYSDLLLPSDADNWFDAAAEVGDDWCVPLLPESVSHGGGNGGGGGGGGGSGGGNGDGGGGGDHGGGSSGGGRDGGGDGGGGSDSLSGSDSGDAGVAGGVDRDEYAATNTSHPVTCPYCGVAFTGSQHLEYLNHMDVCPQRLRRPRQPGRSSR